jgi:hypothetical protein
MNIPALLFAAGFFGRTKSATTPVQRKMSGADGLEASRSRQDRVTVSKASGQPRVGLALTVTNEQTVSVETRKQGSWMFLAEASTDHRRDQCAARTVLPSADQTPEAATDKPQAKELIKIALSPTRPALEKKPAPREAPTQVAKTEQVPPLLREPSASSSAEFAFRLSTACRGAEGRAPNGTPP